MYFEVESLLKYEIFEKIKKTDTLTRFSNSKMLPNFHLRKFVLRDLENENDKNKKQILKNSKPGQKDYKKLNYFFFKE